MIFRLKYLPVWVLISLMLTGCGGSGRLRYDTPQEAYEKGKTYYDKGDYVRAIQYFQGAFDFGRTHEWADDAQLYLARAYRANKEYILASNEYSRFTEIHRRDPRAVEAEYERAMTFYERSPSYQLDQTDTERAVQTFQLFINRYPTSDMVPEAEARIAELREKLARKQYDVAQLYERRSLYQASAISYEAVFDKYADTSWADDALVGAIRSYLAYANESIEERKVERLEQAVEHYKRLFQIFPDSPLLKETEALYEQVDEVLKSTKGESL